jgi:hypothetical protein
MIRHSGWNNFFGVTQQPGIDGNLTAVFALIPLIMHGIAAE